MPTYEYRCSAGHDFEQFQRMSEEPLKMCPQCGAPVERLLSAGGGLLFKGSGFYITDYRSESYRKAAEADSGGKPKESGGKESGGKEGGSKAGGSKEGGSKEGGSQQGGAKEGSVKEGGAKPGSSTASGGTSTSGPSKGE